LEELKPLLIEGRVAETVTVDNELVHWAYKVSSGRTTMSGVYNGYLSKKMKATINFIPCENILCERTMQIGEKVLVTQFVDGGDKRLWCSVACQRSSAVELAVRCVKRNIKELGLQLGKYKRKIN
jgi:hypothetical protein